MFMQNPIRLSLFRAPALLVGAILAVALILVSAGWFYFQNETMRIRTEKSSDLKAVADLKAGQLVLWRKQILSNSRLIAAGLSQPLFRSGLAAADGDPARAELKNLLAKYSAIQECGNLLISSPDGRLLLSLNEELNGLGPPAQALVTASAASGEALLGDFYRCPLCRHIHLDAAAPVLDETGRPLAVLLLRNDPETFLYPLIQSWPTPSESAETLLLRKDGDDVLFLNVLKHKRDPALSLRIPLNQIGVPAVRAALGESGVFMGKDYRGEEVLSDLRAVPDSPWFMVTKVDETEILAEARYRGRCILLFILLGIGVSIFGAVYLFNRRERNLFKRLYLAEQEKREVHAEIRATLYGIGDGVIASDAEGRVTRLNPVAERLTGWSEAEALGKPMKDIFRIINETTRNEVESPVDRVLREGQIVGLANHTLLIAKDGSEKPIADSGAPIRNDQGAVVGVALVFRDQTAERQAQDALQASETHLRSILDGIGANIAVIDRTGTIMTVNRAWQRFGQKNGDTSNGTATGVGANYLAVLQAAQKDAPTGAWEALTGIQNVLEGKVSKASVEYACHSPEKKRWFLLRSTPLLGEKGGAVLVHIDISEAKLADEALTNERNLLYALMDNLPDRVFFKDTQSRFTKISKAHAVSLGLKEPGEAVGKTDADFKPHEVADQTHDEERLLLETGRPVIAKVEKRTKGDGQIQWHSIVKAPIRDRDGRVTGLVGISRDITQEIELQQQLQQALKMDAIGRLAGGVAHDFNNLLQAILGFTELLLEQADRQSTQYTDLKEIEKAARRAADLTRQLLAFSRKQLIEPRVLDLNHSILATEKMLRRVLGENIRIETELAPDLQRIRADHGQVDQIVLNLAVNAQDAMPNGGMLHIATSMILLNAEDSTSIPEARLGEFVCLAVSDTGRGMNADVLPHIFEPFFTTKGLGKGTGLGLAVIYGIVKQHGGWINVYSQLGIGTTFKVYFPVFHGDGDGQPSLQHMEPASAEEVQGKGERILLVEDEAGVRNLATQVLQTSGYTVTACASAEEALTVFDREQGNFDLLFSDVVLPNQNGIDLVDLIQARKPGLPALLCSGYTDSRSRWHVIEERNIPFIQKPYPSAALLNAFRRVLGGR